MTHDILAALWFFAPAGIANAAPVWASLLPRLREFNTPLDAHRTWRGKRLFGDHKTVRGFMAGFVGALLTLLLQRYMYQNSEWLEQLSYFDYSSMNLWLFGALLSVGALGGDSIKSFFKRQLDKPSGSRWFPLDQLDYIIGGLAAASLMVDIDTKRALIITGLYFLIHMLGTSVGYLLGWKRSPL